MKTIAVTCALLALVICAAAVQTFEADTISPKEISELIQDALKPQVAVGKVQDDAISDVSEADKASAAAKHITINVWRRNRFRKHFRRHSDVIDHSDSDEIDHSDSDEIPHSGSLIRGIANHVYHRLIARMNAMEHAFELKENEHIASLQRRMYQFNTYIDICGVTGGDDSTCSRNPGQGFAYSVGDPHYKSWDGAYFDEHPSTYWGEMVLFKHEREGGRGDIEIQTATVPWFQNSWDESDRSNTGAKGNSAIAIAVGGNVMVFYARDHFQTYFINGRQVFWPNFHDWRRVGTNLRAYKWGGHYQILINIGDGYLHLAGYLVGSNNLDIYGYASSSWATGKMTGLWGDWDGNAGNDRQLINTMNSQGKLSVLGTPRSYFKDKKPRTDAQGQFLLACDMQLDTSHNRIIPGDTMTADIQQAAKDCADKEAIVKKNCIDVYGEYFDQCSGDICLADNEDHPRLIGQERHQAQVEQKRTLLLSQADTSKNQAFDTCMILNQDRPVNGLSHNGGNSFSVAFWIRQEGTNIQGTIFTFGESTLTSSLNGDIVFASNGASCTAKGAIGNGWKHVIAVSYGTTKLIEVYVGGQVACSVAGNDFPTVSKDVTLQLGSIDRHISAKIARPVYVASAVFSNEVSLFTDTRPACAD